jgi:phage recombination protein Bet
MAAQRQELTILPYQNITMWDEEASVQEIQRIFAPTLSVVEFKIFVAVGKATGLNPYLKEIWAVKYDNKTAQIFIGRDGYRKSAQRHPHYDYHLADAVYENDDFSVEDGEVKHKYSLKNRGTLLGAYCTVKRKGSSKANFVYVELKEYDKLQSTWKTMKITMIKKVAEAQALRSSFQEIFAGTYYEGEQFDQVEVVEAPKPAKGMNALEEALGIREDIEFKVEDIGPLLAEMNQLIIDKNVPQKSRDKWCKQFGVNSLDDIPTDGMEAIIKHLKKEKV